jgi:uncharacterized protein YjdB
MVTIMNRKLIGRVAAAFAAGITISCSDRQASEIAGLALNDSTGDEARVASASVTLALSSLEVGQSTQATALLLDYRGRPLAWSVTWSSGNSVVATVSSSGLVTARSTGAAAITATRGSKSGSATLTVIPTTDPQPPPVASVSVSLPVSSLIVGQTIQAAATTRDSSNNVVTGRAIIWSSSNVSVATISVSGLVTALAAGSLVISAASEGQTGSATITVTAAAPPPPPATQPGTVSNLSVSAIASTSVTLSFTQVNDGTGLPARYDVRYAVAPISWGSAASTTNGTCTTPVSGTAIGSQLTCTVLGLSPSTNYNFQLVAFRGTPNSNAVYGGLSNIASASTTAGALPPPPPTGTNEPAGLTAITDRPFNSTTPTYAAGEDGWWDSNNGTLQIIQDATAPRSPNSVARMVFSGGISGGYAPATLERPVSARTIYAASWVKFSSNWQSHASGVNKILHFWIGGGNKLVITAAGYVATGPLTARISLQGIVSGGNNADGGISGTYESSKQFVRGQWHKIEVIAVANTTGANDGTVKLYLDGVLAVQCSGIRFTSASSPTWTLVSWAPVWGGTGGTVTSTMYEYMDHIYLSGKQ